MAFEHCKEFTTVFAFINAHKCSSVSVGGLLAGGRQSRQDQSEFI